MRYILDNVNQLPAPAVVNGNTKNSVYAEKQNQDQGEKEIIGFHWKSVKSILV